MMLRSNSVEVQASCRNERYLWYKCLDLIHPRKFTQLSSVPYSICLLNIDFFALLTKTNCKQKPEQQCFYSLFATGSFKITRYFSVKLYTKETLSMLSAMKWFSKNAFTHQVKMTLIANILKEFTLHRSMVRESGRVT
jgi:hypothetical protein